MEERCKNDQEKSNLICTAKEKVSKFATSMWQEAYEYLLNDPDLMSYNTLFIDYIGLLKYEGDNLCQFWLTYLDMVAVLLHVLYANRTGQWHLLLEGLREITMYAFAYDNYNYARYLPACCH